MPSRRDRIRGQLADLKLPGALESLDDVLTGVESAFQMAQVAGALVGGLLFANALLKPRRSL